MQFIGVALFQGPCHQLPVTYGKLGGAQEWGYFKCQWQTHHHHNTHCALQKGYINHKKLKCQWHTSSSKYIVYLYVGSRGRQWYKTCGRSPLPHQTHTTPNTHHTKHTPHQTHTTPNTHHTKYTPHQIHSLCVQEVSVFRSQIIYHPTFVSSQKVHVPINIYCDDQIRLNVFLHVCALEYTPRFMISTIVFAIGAWSTATIELTIHMGKMYIGQRHMTRKEQSMFGTYV